MPNRTLILLQYMDLWREVWTDGRTLPTNVGGRGKDAHDPKYNGYSIGRWEDDYTFVVETTGLAPETWATKSGYPHSVDAHVVERFHRSSKNDLSLSITMTTRSSTPHRSLWGKCISGGFRTSSSTTLPAYRQSR